MRSLPRIAALCLLAACISPPVNHADSMVFGDVELGQSRTVAFVLENRGPAPLALTFAAAGEFIAEEKSITVGAGQSSIIHVRFTPSDLGPRTGLLSAHSTLEDFEVTLSGRGTGARLSAPAQLSLGFIAIVTGEPPLPFMAKLVVQNVGTSGSALVLGTPRVDGADLCVGTFVGTTCHAWEPPDSVDPQDLLEVPLSVLATTLGQRQWSVVFPSNDPLRPEVTVEVIALVEAFGPCIFSAPDEVKLIVSPTVLHLTHLGADTCLVKEVTVSSEPAGFLQFMNAARLPLRLAPGASMDWSIALRPSAPWQLTGNVHVVAAGTTPMDIPLRREAAQSGCLTLTPSPVDFGAVRQDCSSANKSVQIYNSCSSPVTLYEVEMAAGGPEFFAWGISLGTVLLPGGPPAVLSLKYTPLDFGSDTGAVRINTLEAGEFFIALQARGDTTAHQTDTYHQEGPPNFRDTFYLTSQPADPLQLQLHVDGLSVPSSDWNYDTLNNTVVFVAGHAPAPGETLVINYSTACMP